MSFFFFKQKTAYEMRISDWTSDVCSSDLADHCRAAGLAEGCPRAVLCARPRGLGRGAQYQRSGDAGGNPQRMQPRPGNAVRRGRRRGGEGDLRGGYPEGDGDSDFRRADLRTERRAVLGPGPPRLSRTRPGEGLSGWRASGSCPPRSEEHTSELQSLIRISYAVFCL